MKQKIFNPLEHVSISTSTDSLESTAALINTDIGVCPKCKEPMGQAKIANEDTVFYCAKCRVSTPTPDSQPLV